MASSAAPDQGDFSGTSATLASSRVVRVEVWRKGEDPRAAALVREAAAIGVPLRSARFADVFLIEGPLGEEAVARVAEALLSSPVLDRWNEGAAAARGAGGGEAWTIEIHPLPGVMDPPALTVGAAIHDILEIEVKAATGLRCDLEGVTGEQADLIARRLLANPVIHAIHASPFHPEALPEGTAVEQRVKTISLVELDDAALERLSRDAHLFLSLEEMRAIQGEYRRLGREPTDIELETLAQTWSEHCVHKTMKARIRYRGEGADRIDWSKRPGHMRAEDGTIIIDNLLRSTVAAATRELIDEGIDWTLSVFVDNAGVIAFDEERAVCVKVETHNHPSAIEPYGGAATGIGGCIRDIIGTGLAAKPIASTDVFCVAPPDLEEIPAGCLHPRRILKQVVAGVRDYGNRMGIPTVNGAVAFDERYVGNPLVFCGCVGVMPRELVHGEAKAGDLIVALGGRTGRDGIHGATFSSAELTDTHADEFAHAVQIGNAIEEKKVLDAILRARDFEGGCLYSAITDCGAGGFSSAIGEMGAEIGAEVHLERAPLKYAGLTYTEIWISEAQERMVLAVPAEKLAALQDLCAEEDVELAHLGTFGTPGEELILNFAGVEVGRLSMHFLHEGLPTPEREAVWRAPAAAPRGSTDPAPLDVQRTLLDLLAHPDIASKRWIVRQYDHEVQGATVLKPLVGPEGRGPGDAAVIEPAPGTGKGLAIGCGLATGVGDPARGGDPYLMALAAVDECVRNLVCVGADPERIAILDNFCWPSCQKPGNLAALVRAAEGCYDAAKAYRTPFVSGKDSLNNQFTTEDGRTIEIPPTLLISGIGIVADVERCVTSDMKGAGSTLLLVGRTGEHLGGSHLDRLLETRGRSVESVGGAARVPTTDLEQGPLAARGVARAIAAGHVLAAHDCSDGGALVAIAEMLIGARDGVPIGAEIDLSEIAWMAGAARSSAAAAFSENTSRYMLEIAPESEEAVRRALADAPCAVIGRTDDSGRLTAAGLSVDVAVADLQAAWEETLDW